VLALGMVILMIEAFAERIDKRVLAFAAITGLGLVLLASFFVAPSPWPAHATGFWSFYTADELAMFFKQFALLTTIFVLIMVLDCPWAWGQWGLAVLLPCPRVGFVLFFFPFFFFFFFFFFVFFVLFFFFFFFLPVFKGVICVLFGAETKTPENPGQWKANKKK